MEEEVITLKKQLLSALLTAVSCTSNEFSFDNEHINMRERIIELEKELGIEHSINVYINGDLISVSAELEITIIKEWIEEHRRI